MKGIKNNDIDSLFFTCLNRDIGQIEVYGIEDTYPSEDQMEDKYYVEDSEAWFDEINCDGDYRYEPIEDCYKELIEDRINTIEGWEGSSAISRQPFAPTVKDALGKMFDPDECFLTDDRKKICMKDL